MIRKFSSRYISDVIISDTGIELKDSNGLSYYIDITNTTVVSEFKIWFENIFAVGKAQTLTVFQYENIEVSECEIEMRIVKFITQKHKLP
jgi:hypothetical protein